MEQHLQLPALSAQFHQPINKDYRFIFIIYNYVSQWWPSHLYASKHVQVQVEHTLSSMLATVDYCSRCVCVHVCVCVSKREERGRSVFSGEAHAGH